MNDGQSLILMSALVIAISVVGTLITWMFWFISSSLSSQIQWEVRCARDELRSEIRRIRGT